MLKRDVKSPIKVTIVADKDVAAIINNGINGEKRNLAANKIPQNKFTDGLNGTLFTEKLKEHGVDEKLLQQLNNSDVIAKIAKTIKEENPQDDKNKGKAIPWEDAEIQLLVCQHLANPKKLNAKELGKRIGTTLGRAPPAKSTLSEYLKKHKAGTVSSYAITKDFEITFSNKLKKNLIVINRPDCRAFFENKVKGNTTYYRCYSCDKAQSNNPEEDKTVATAILSDDELKFKVEHHPLCTALNEPEFSALLIVRKSRDTLRKDKTVLPKQAYDIGKKEAQEAGEPVNYYEPYNKYRCGHTRAANFKNDEEKEEVKLEGFKKQLKDGCFVINSNKNNKLFSSPTQLDLLSKCKIAVADATFSPAPRGFKQVWSFHALYQRDDGSREWKVVATAIMKRKKYQAYRQVIGWLKQAMIDRGLEISGIERIHVDFERAQYNAFKYHFGNIVYGCSFHLAQGVIRKAQRIGLMKFYHEEEVRRWVRALMALNMLPYDHAVRLFNLRFKKPPKKPKTAKKWPGKKLFTEMANYFKKTWLTDKLRISFYGLRIVRNTNAAEAFNAQLQRDPIVKKHPALPQFYVTVANLFRDVATRIYRLYKGMDTRPTVKKYEEMDRILAEREAIYERDVISRYEELSDEEFCELAYSHVKRCSYLVQRVKKVKSVIKNVIKEEITNAKDKVVATDDEHDENVDNVEMSKEPDMFDESEEESETDDNESAYESDDYVDSDESGESYDYEDNFQESYIHSDYEPKKLKNVKNESPSFTTPSPAFAYNDFDSQDNYQDKKLKMVKKGSSAFITPSPVSKANERSWNSSWNNVPTPPSPKSSRYQYSLDERQLTLSNTRSKRKLEYEDQEPVSKFKQSKPNEDLIDVTESTKQATNGSSDIIFDGDFGMSKFEYKFTPPKDEFLQSLCIILRSDKVNINVLKNNSPLLKMPKATIIGPPTAYFDVEGDGNCGWRSLSYGMLGTTAHHWTIRKLVTNYRSFNKDKEGVENWNIIKHQSERSTVNERRLWMSDGDLIAVAKFFMINILCYKEMGKFEENHWTCYAPGIKQNLIQDQNCPDVCIVWSKEEEHYRAVTAFETIL